MRYFHCSHKLLTQNGDNKKIQKSIDVDCKL